KYDTQRSDYPTHQGLISSSQIDYVWSSVNVISNFVGCKTVQLASTLTDHSIIILYVENFLKVKYNKWNIPLKKVYDYNKMIKDKWLAFTNKTDALNNGCYLRSLNNKTVFNQNKLN
ncbi:2019_t:CDS:1, partial [Funneliformis geosporum]